MLSCKEVGELLSLRLDRKLTFKERIGLKLHLLICKTCNCYQKQLQFVTRSARRLMASDKAQQGIPPLSEAAEKRINSSIQQQIARDNKHR